MALERQRRVTISPNQNSPALSGVFYCLKVKKNKNMSCHAPITGAYCRPCSTGTRTDRSDKMQTFFAESMQMLFKKQPKVSRQYVALTKSEAFTEAHKIARNMCQSVKYQQRFALAYKKVLKENCVLLKKKNTLDYYVHAEDNKSFHVLISAYSADQAIDICRSCGFFEQGETLQALTYLLG